MITPFIPAISSNPHQGIGYAPSDGSVFFALAIIFIAVAMLCYMARMK